MSNKYDLREAAKELSGTLNINGQETYVDFNDLNIPNVHLQNEEPGEGIHYDFFGMDAVRPYTDDERESVRSYNEQQNQQIYDEAYNNLYNQAEYLRDGQINSYNSFYEKDWDDEVKSESKYYSRKRVRDFRGQNFPIFQIIGVVVLGLVVLFMIVSMFIALATTFG